MSHIPAATHAAISYAFGIYRETHRDLYPGVTPPGIIWSEMAKDPDGELIWLWAQIYRMEEIMLLKAGKPLNSWC